MKKTKMPRTKAGNWILRLRWTVVVLTALSSLALVAIKLRSTWKEENRLDDAYPAIERLFTIYSLARWKHPNQEEPLVSETVHAESAIFRLKLPAAESLTEAGRRSILFEAFKLPRMRTFEDMVIEGEQIGGGEDMRFSFRWRTVFGYDVDVTVSPVEFATIGQASPGGAEATSEEDVPAGRDGFRAYQVMATLPALAGQAREHAFIVADHIVHSHQAGSREGVQEWACYDADGTVITFSELESVIALTLRKLGLAELDVAQVAPQLEARWLQRDERLMAALSEAIRELPEASKVEKFLDLAGAKP
jgi:hypothetical protein